MRPDVARAILGHGGGLYPSGGQLLDMGCGTGCITVPLAQMGNEVWGIDAETSAIELTRQRRDTHNASSLNLKQANWAHLPDVFPSDFFDTAVCWGNSLNYTDSWLGEDLQLERSQRLIESTLRGVFASLKPGGAFLLQVDGGFSSGKRQVRRRTKTIEEDLRRHVLDWRIEQTEEGIRRNRACRSVYSAEGDLLDTYEIEFVGQALFTERLVAMLRQAGFSNVEVNASTQEAVDSYHVIVARK